MHILILLSSCAEFFLRECAGKTQSKDPYGRRIRGILVRA